jgi:rhodanese-related sulfurtransferase
MAIDRIALTALLTLAAPAVAFAGDGPGCHGGATVASVGEISVETLASRLETTPTKTVVFDANGDSTREKYGVIPGARLLTSYASFAESELPSDKAAELVFYCGSKACSAAPKAAQRAVDAGWTNVHVLTAGIKGWAAAGRPTVKPTEAKKGPAST